MKRLSHASLHILAMLLMLCDHLWATVVPGSLWLTMLGRLAYPIFAFLIVEGYCHTRDMKQYLRRLLLFALVTEIPFNLMYGGGWFYPFHQNVLWTFLLSLVCLLFIDGLRSRFQWWLAIPLSVVTAGFFLVAARLLMLDYYDYGVLTILVFYLFRGSRWWQILGQLAGLAYINLEMIHGQMLLLPGGMEFPLQGFAVLAILPIWLYNGRKGYDAAWFRWFCYGFYPVHMLILGLLT